MSLSLCSAPGIRLQVIEDRIQGELALAQGDEELLEDRELLRRVLLHLRGVQIDLQHFLDLLARVFLRPFERVAFRQLVVPQLVHENVSPEGHQSDETVAPDRIQTLLDRELYTVQFLLRHAEIDHENKHLRLRLLVRLDVLDRREFLLQFRGQVHFGNMLGVVRWERVPRPAERTLPDLRPEIHLAVRVQNRLALAGELLVLHERQVFDVLEGRVERADRHHAFRRGQLGGRQVVPTQTDPVVLLLCKEIHSLFLN